MATIYQLLFPTFLYPIIESRIVERSYVVPRTYWTHRCARTVMMSMSHSERIFLGSFLI